MLLGNGDGSFQAPHTFNTGSQPITLALGDVNGDSPLDLAAIDIDRARVLLGNGDGSFRTTNFTYVAGGRPIAVAVADVNDDHGKRNCIRPTVFPTTSACSPCWNSHRQARRAGRQADFHSLRYFFCTLAGVRLPIQKVRGLMRHRDIRTTCNLYMDLGMQEVFEEDWTLPQLLTEPPVPVTDKSTDKPESQSS